jgi:hypothetical protein
MYRDRTTLGLYPYLRAFGEATVLEYIKTFGNRLYRAAEREMLVQWVQVLIALGLWDNHSDYLEFLKSTAMPRLVRALLEELNTHKFATNTAVRKDILFRIPCPLRSLWDRHIKVLGHKLLLALVDHDYFAVNKDLPEFIPSLFCSMVVTVNPTLTVSALPQLQPNDRHRLLGRAFRWLTKEMPQVGLPEAVEKELSNFAWRRLALNPER